MATEQVQKLLERLIEVAPDRGMRRKVERMHARLIHPMTLILDKVPGETVIEKSRYLGVTRQTMYAWMDGTMRPNLKRAKMIAKVTGVDVDVIRGIAA